MRRIFFSLTLALVISFGWATLIKAQNPGDLDADFGVGGIVTTTVSIGGPLDIGRGAAIQSDGKVVVTGKSSGSSSDDDITVVRYNTDGRLDTSFNGTGIVTTSVSNGNNGNEVGWAVAVQSNNKIVIAGTSDDVIDTIVVVRYTPDGHLDSTFNSAGIVTTTINNGNTYGRSIAIQSDGRIVVINGLEKLDSGISG